MLRLSIMAVLANWGLLSFLNNRGDAGAGGAGDGDGKGGKGGDEKLLTQAQVDAIVQDRLSREKSKYADYEDLRKFKTEHEKNLEATAQKELEAKKEYEKLKEGFTKKEQELTGIISQKDAAITDMKVSSALMTEISKQNAHAEETLALLKGQTVIDKEGNVRIKGRDANGLEVMDSIEEGLKKFLTNRPHLVKVTQKAGGGTGAGNGGGSGAGVGGDDLDSLNKELPQAQARGDSKRVNEIKTKMRVLIGAQKAQL